MRLVYHMPIWIANPAVLDRRLGAEPYWMPTGHDRSNDCGPCQIKYGGFFISSAALG